MHLDAVDRVIERLLTQKAEKPKPKPKPKPKAGK